MQAAAERTASKIRLFWAEFGHLLENTAKQKGELFEGPSLLCSDFPKKKSESALASSEIGPTHKAPPVAPRAPREQPWRGAACGWQTNPEGVWWRVTMTLTVCATQ